MRFRSWGVYAAVIYTAVIYTAAVLALSIGSMAASSAPPASTRLGATVTSGARTASTEAEQRTVSFFFSAEAWGGTPFSVQEKQEAMARAMLGGGFQRLEKRVAHLVTGQGGAGAQVRSFSAVFEVDVSVRPPKMRTGYELELTVPRLSHTLEVELINGETGVVNIVQIAPEGV